jgi:hypothetical protein
MTSVGPEDAGATAASVDPGDAGAVDPRDAGSSDPGPTPVTPAYRAAPGRQHAVRWLSPTELARTAVVVLKGTIFAQYADKREVMSGVPEHVFAQSVSDEDMVIDYVADIGDGFEATYAVASSIARAREVVDRPTNVHSLVGAKTPDCACGDPDEAGRLLVLGGDEVYPYADVPQYKHRTLSVYRLAAALGRVPADAHALAIPGNHDWYDGLVAFRRIFCESWVTSEPLPRYAMSLPPRENLDTFAGAWATFQERSYYAVRLPHGWWLWGIDIQLAAPIDAEQLEYFRRARAHLEDDDRVIICTGKPGWTDAADRDDEARHSDRQILAWFVDRMFGNDEAKRRVRLLISGDKHYYARHSPERPDASFSPTLITCGGGGAYLSSTHHLQESIQPFTFDTPGYVSVPPLSEMPDHDPSRSWSLRERYPTRAQSENLRRGFWRIPFRNDRLPVLVAGIYVLLVWFAAVAQSRSAWPSPELLGWKVLDQASSGSAVPLVLTVALLTGLLTVYAKSTSKMTKKRAWALGGAHTLGHLVVAYT